MSEQERLNGLAAQLEEVRNHLLPRPRFQGVVRHLTEALEEMEFHLAQLNMSTPNHPDGA